jgi:hypothetical protein
MVPKYLRNIAGLHTKVKIYSRLRISGHKGMMDKTYFSTEEIPPISYWLPSQLQKDREDPESSREEHESATQ